MYGNLPEITVAGGRTIRGFAFEIGSQNAVLRLPTFDEAKIRLDASKLIRRKLGRKRYQTTPQANYAADRALFNALRLDSGAEFTDNEVRATVGTLFQADVKDARKVDFHIVVMLSTPFGDTIHTFATPQPRDVHRYHQELFFRTRRGRDIEELQTNSGAHGALYDSAIRQSEGYADGTPVPPHHKTAAVRALLDAIR